MAGGAPGGGGSQAFASTLTDLMTSLAVIFILLLVIFLKQAHDQSRRAKDDVQKELQTFLKEKELALKQDAEDPLKLTVAVGESQLRFPVGGSSLSSDGGSFVESFFHNFAAKICSREMQDKVDSIVIEATPTPPASAPRTASATTSPSPSAAPTPSSSARSPACRATPPPTSAFSASPPPTAADRGAPSTSPASTTRISPAAWRSRSASAPRSSSSRPWPRPRSASP
jgi:hypothetical protein